MATFWVLAVVFAAVLFLAFIMMSLRRGIGAKHGADEPAPIDAGSPHFLMGAAATTGAAKTAADQAAHHSEGGAHSGGGASAHSGGDSGGDGGGD
jgi:hypothetical protein